MLKQAFIRLGRLTDILIRYIRRFSLGHWSFNWNVASFNFAKRMQKQIGFGYKQFSNFTFIKPRKACFIQRLWKKLMRLRE